VTRVAHRRVLEVRRRENPAEDRRKENKD